MDIYMYEHNDTSGNDRTENYIKFQIRYICHIGKNKLQHINNLNGKLKWCYLIGGIVLKFSYNAKWKQESC